MHHTADVRKCFVKFDVGQGIGGGTQIPFHHIAVQIHNDHILGSQFVITDTAGFDDHSDIPPHIYAALMDPDLIKTVKERVENMDKRTYISMEELEHSLREKGMLS